MKTYSPSVDLKEVEANQLGAALLMPKGLVQEQIRGTTGFGRRGCHSLACKGI